jgi:hypothetical protein
MDTSKPTYNWKSVRELGKQIRKCFPKSQTWATKSIELVQFDLCIPFPIKSLVGLFYFMTFLDDKSWKVWVYFLKKKSEAFSKFLLFRHEVENQTTKSI